MYPFTYTAVTKEGQAIDAIATAPMAHFLAGGTNLVDEMKLNVRRPTQLIDINSIGLNKIEARNGGLRIGALVKNSDLAYDESVMSMYPVMSEALLSGASAQLRNMATTGGNLLQKTRCTYYRDTHYENCNKRNPGSGCAAIEGFNRMHALLGTSDQCIATHPSDMCVAMAALDAMIVVKGPKGERSIPLADFYVAYGDDPAKENTLAHDELITAVDLPALPWAKRSLYLKTRDRASYEFALASAAVALELDGNSIKSARVALGGIAAKPWRSKEAEASLVGKDATDATFAAAATAALATAKPQKYNAFKVDLAKRTIVQALTNAAAMA
ncbi:MAG: xanthine dehydrogenase family protein subunit [Phycisphaerales bacterium]|nr:xanthine dehydrogenase family protein subunit [Phycisphaerales bacterium]